MPFVPISARSNSSSKTGTGISNALTSSVVPSPQSTVSTVGSKSSALSFEASFAVPKKRFTMCVDVRATCIVALPSFTVSVPLLSYASFTWNIELSVVNSAVYVPSERAIFSVFSAFFVLSVASCTAFLLSVSGFVFLLPQAAKLMAQTSVIATIQVNLFLNKFLISDILLLLFYSFPTIHSINCYLLMAAAVCST